MGWQANVGLASGLFLREFGIRGICHINYRVAVDLLIGQGWEQRRPTLPKLYVSKARSKALVFLRLSNLLGDKPIAKNNVIRQ